MKEPYLQETVTTIVRKYNPNYGDNKICQCGHPYYRHFDSYEDNFAIGCKYCACHTFKRITKEQIDKLFHLKHKDKILCKFKNAKSFTTYEAIFTAKFYKNDYDNPVIMETCPYCMQRLRAIYHKQTQGVKE